MNILPPHVEKAQRKERRRDQLIMQGIPAGTEPQTLADIMQARADRRRKRNLGRRQNELEQRLQKLTTRELLDMMQLHRGDFRSHLYADEEMQSTMETVEWWAIKKVLATRPHVMRKIEAHCHRSWVAVRQHGQGKSQNRGEKKKPQKLSGTGSLFR